MSSRRASPRTASGYAEALRLRAARAGAAGVRGRGHRLVRRRPDPLPRRHGEQVFEVGRLRRERRSGGKTDALDAVRAARSVLEQKRPATPRSSGEREALRALMAAREGAVNAKRAGLYQLRDLLVTTPEPLRSELRPLSRHGCCSRLAATRPRQPPRPRAPRHAARPARGRSTRPAADRRGARARTRDREAHPQARPAAARPARRRPAARRPDRALLVTPRPPPQRGRLRPARRRRTDPRLLRPDDPLPPRPRRRPPTQPRTAP